MKKLNVARVIDVAGWAYHYVSQEHSRYSRHNIVAISYDEKNITGYDVIYVHSPDISTHHIEFICQESKERKLPLIGAYAGDPAFWHSTVKKTYSHADIVAAISPQTLLFARTNYSIPVVFVPESIDTEFFKTNEFHGNRFNIGWAGGLHKQVKRAHLLDRLKFPVLKQCAWGGNNFSKNRTLHHMLDFYKEIDVLVVTSASECQPRVVMEAMSCGLPVVSTDVGSMRMLIGSEWTVRVMPEDVMVREMNERLKMLKRDSALRESVGKRNAEHVRKLWSWSANTALWDDVLENTSCGNHTASVEMCNQFCKKANMNILYSDLLGTS